VKVEEESRLVVRTEEPEPHEGKAVETPAADAHENEEQELERVLAGTLGRVGERDPMKVKVSRERLITFMRNEQQRLWHCCQLPFVLLYFMFFVATVLLHEDVENLSTVERQFRNAFEGTTFEGIHEPYPVSGHKDMTELDVPEDIFTYLNDAFLPNFLPEEPEANLVESSRVLRYNMMIAGVQIQQIRRLPTLCNVAHPNLGPKDPDTDVNPILASVMCYPWGVYDNNCFGRSVGVEGFCPQEFGKGTEAAPDDTGDTDSTENADNTDGTRRMTAAESAAAAGKATARKLFPEESGAKVKGSSWEAASGGWFSGAVYSILINPQEGLAAAQAKMTQYHELGWLDSSTAWVGVKIFIMNPDLSVYLHAVVNFWFTPTGGLVTGIGLTSWSAEPYQYMSRVGVDFFFVLFWFQLLLQVIIDLIMAIILEKAKAYWMDIFSIADWLGMLGGMLIIVCWLVYVVMLGEVGTKTLEVHEAALAAAVSSQKSAEYYELALAFHNHVAGFAGFVTLYRLFVCNYMLILILRFFKAFQAQPRLAIVTNTVLFSLSDIGHFMIVLITFFTSYAVAGMFLFGHRLFEFSELRLAIHQCFLIMLGSIDYEALSSEHPQTAGLWIWSFVVFVSIIMLNMALAIVMDVHSVVATEASNAPMMWTQMGDSLVKLRNRNGWMRFGTIINAIKLMDDNIEFLTPDELRVILPEMQVDQAIHLVAEAAASELAEEQRGLSLSQAFKMLRWIKRDVKGMAHTIQDILDMEEDQKVIRDKLGLLPGEFIGSGIVKKRFDPGSEDKIDEVDGRLTFLETNLKNSMQDAVLGSREVREKLSQLEALIDGDAGLPGPPPVDPDAAHYTLLQGAPMKYSA